MEEKRIKAGQRWVADFHGRRLRVVVIAADHEAPGFWLCEDLGTGERSGPGPHILINKSAFLRQEPAAGEISE